MKIMNDRTPTSAVLKTICFMAFAVILLVASCTTSPVASGNGSGTGVGNGIISGHVIYADSTPVKGAIVRLRTQGYLSDTSGAKPLSNGNTLATMTTDTCGHFAIASIDTGYSYCLEVNDNKVKTQATLYKFSFKQDSLVLATRIVKPAVKVYGKITLTGLPANAYVQVYGLEKLSRTDSTGAFEIKDLPEGECEQNECEYKLRILSPQPNGSVKSLDYELEINSGSDTTIARIELENH